MEIEMLGRITQFPVRGLKQQNAIIMEIEMLGRITQFPVRGLKPAF